MSIYEMQLRVTGVDGETFDLNVLTVDGETPAVHGQGPVSYRDTYKTESPPFPFDWAIYQTPDTQPGIVQCHAEAAPTPRAFQIALSARSRMQGGDWPGWVRLKDDDKPNDAGNVSLSAWFDIKANKKSESPGPAIPNIDAVSLLHQRVGRAIAMLHDIQGRLPARRKKKKPKSSPKGARPGAKKGRGR